MISLLILHIIFGTLLVVAFVVRYIAVIMKKISPKTGRSLIAGLSVLLLTSGFALVIAYKAPLSGLCVASIAIISGVVAAEYGLVIIRNKFPVK